MKGLPPDQFKFRGDHAGLMILEKALKDAKVDYWNQWIASVDKKRRALGYGNEFRCDLSGINFRGMMVTGLDLSCVSLVSADFKDADLRRVKLTNSDLYEANLVNARISDSHLGNCKLTSSQANAAIFTNSVLESANIIDARWHDVRFVNCNLKRTNLQGASCCGVEFEKTNLVGCDLRFADFTGADFSSALMMRADLRDGLFDRACFRHANLNESDLRLARLILCDFAEASLTGAKLWSAITQKWFVRNVICDYAFVDERGQEKYPKDRPFASGEFERIFGHSPVIDVFFKHGIEVVDIVVINEVLRLINDSDTTLKLRLVAISNEDVTPKMCFKADSRENLEALRLRIEAEYTQKLDKLRMEVAGLQVENRVLEKITSELITGLASRTPHQTIYQLGPGALAAQCDTLYITAEKYATALKEIDSAQLEPEKNRRLKEILVDIRKGATSEVGKVLVGEAKELLRDAAQNLPTLMTIFRSAMDGFM